jgi:carbonic anhydrase
MPIELEKLIAGYARFRDNFKSGSNLLYKHLSEQGQNPSAIVIACSDSRVDPAIILDCDPGNLFMIRNVANLVPPYEDDHHYHGTSAALEFGVCHLNIPHIIILGHSQCGGIKSLLEKNTIDPNGFIAKWMQLATLSPRVKMSEDFHLPIEHQAELCEKESLAGSLDNLMTFPWIQKRVQENNVILHGWYFNLFNGTIDYFDQKTRQFLPLVQEAH